MLLHSAAFVWKEFPYLGEILVLMVSSEFQMQQNYGCHMTGKVGSHI
jgi:hypothetical protein